jgi:hypothetical protein
MKIPQKVNIGGIIFNVNLISGKSGNTLHERDYLGNIDYEKCIITADKDLNEQMVDITFMHEVMHGIANQYGVDLEEEDVERLARGIYQVLRDNKLLKE